VRFKQTLQTPRHSTTRIDYRKTHDVFPPVLGRLISAPYIKRA